MLDCTKIQQLKSSRMTSYTHCPTNSLPTSTHASSLTPNSFHKLCPAQHPSYISLGQPSCGDGTPFSFFFSRPPLRLANENKLLIEFQGGGACWNAQTCNLQSSFLTYPEQYDDFVGKSCSEIDYGLGQNGDTPISMLCAKSIGATDFREYNTVIVPYCTQDVHIGDSVQSYGDDDGSGTVRHVGGHNMISVLNWIFANFPNPSHIFLTGCSAGGTAVPIAYDLINKHYNTLFRGSGVAMKSVDIGVIMDSSVYLTPQVFLERYYDNWNPGTVMKKIRFDFEKYRYESNYPDILWQHILKRGPNSDRWGFVTHSSDPISLMYYQYMSGNGDNNQRSMQALTSNSNNKSLQSNRSLEDMESEWWYGIQSSMSSVKAKHSKNVDFYIMDGEGHCSFGLYYPLLYEGFEEWASPIVKESVVVGNNRPAASSFLLSIAFGSVLMLSALAATRQKNRSKLLNDEASSDSTHANRMPSILVKLQTFVLQQASRFSSCPWTASYLLTTTIYFICMMVHGLTHPLENPTIGPSAVSLSSFGINNPSLVIYRMEYYRLFTSTFLCSGVFSYLSVMFSMYRYASGLEGRLMTTHPHWVYGMILVLLAMGINLVYACLGNGASCTSMALALGVNVFSGIMARRFSDSSGGNAFPTSWGFTITFLILGSTPLFPFDSVVALSASVVIGTALALLLFDEKSLPTEADDSSHNAEIQKESLGGNVRWNIVKVTGAVYAIIYLLLVFHVPSPDKRNVYPYLTGCNLVYSDQIGDFAKQYASDYIGRKLEGGNDDLFDGQDMCAQLCVPHVVHRPLVWGVRKFGLLEVEEGTCEENGYYEHVADKTVREYTVTLEVQVFTVQSDDE